MDTNTKSGNPSKSKSNRVLEQATELKTNIQVIENELLERTYDKARAFKLEKMKNEVEFQLNEEDEAV